MTTRMGLISTDRRAAVGLGIRGAAVAGFGIAAQRPGTVVVAALSVAGGLPSARC